MIRRNFIFRNLFVMGIVSMMGLSVTGCLDKNFDNNGDGDKSEETTPNDFDFSTSKQVAINLHYPNMLGSYVNVELYTENPLALDEAKSYVKVSTQAPFLEGRTDSDGNLTFTVTLPSAATEIYAYSTTLGAPALLRADISANAATNFAVAEIPAQTNRSSRGIGVNIHPFENTTSVNGVYSNWVKMRYTSRNNTPIGVTSLTIKKEWQDDIDRTLDASVTNIDRYKYQGVKISEDATVNIYYVGHGNNNRINALTYYTYGTDGMVRPESVGDVPIYDKKEGTLIKDVKNPSFTIGTSEKACPLTLAMENLSSAAPTRGTGYKMQYYNGSSFQDQFPAGSCINFALLVDPYQGNTLQDKVNAVFSELDSNGGVPYSYNEYVIGGTIRHNVPHMVAFKLDETHMVIAFEDQPYKPNTGTYSGDFKDDVFILEITPKVPTDLPDPINPEDPEYNTVYREGSILGFEDNWPKAGDYDMNDVMLSYVRASYYKEEKGAFPKLVMWNDEFTFLNNGATYTNAFGYSLGYTGSKDDFTTTVSSDYQCEGQGLDADITNDNVVMLFNNGKAVPKDTKFTVKTIFKTSPAWNGIKEINPFIVVNGYLEQGRKEVHLVNNAPTSKGGTEWFGTEADLSNGTDSWYVLSKETIHPFAISIAADISLEGYTVFPNFKVPQESKPIEESYPDFKTWYESNGKSATDWYEHPSFQ